MHAPTPATAKAAAGDPAPASARARRPSSTWGAKQVQAGNDSQPQQQNQNQQRETTSTVVAATTPLASPRDLQVTASASQASAAAPHTAAPAFQPKRRVLRSAQQQAAPQRSQQAAGPSRSNSSNTGTSTLTRLHLTAAAVPADSRGSSYNGQAPESASNGRRDEAAHHDERAEHQSATMMPRSPFEAASVLPTPELTPNKASGVHAWVRQEPAQPQTRSPVLAADPSSSEKAKDELCTALQALISASGLQASHKQVLLEALPALVDSRTDAGRLDASRGGQKQKAVLILACIATLVSLASLVCSLWVLFMMLDAGFILI